MPSRIDLNEIRSAWNALASEDALPGWCSIRVAPTTSLPVRAARRLPGGEPSILVGAHQASIPSPQHLPNARGFKVERAEDVPERDSQAWLAITLLEERDQELFESMVLDLLRILSGSEISGCDAKSATTLLIGRIRAWQEFMDRSRRGLLSEAEEIGLVGELYFLRAILQHGIDARTAVESWKGPFGGLQDFLLGLGAIEVKSSVSVSEFPAKIGNLDQLDSSLASPLFLSTARLELDPLGATLGMLANEILEILSGSPTIQDQFRLGLLKTGYLEIHSENHVRRFKLVQHRIFPVTDGFPRLTHHTVPVEVVHASYTIDMDRIQAPSIDLEPLLILLGVK